MNTTTRFIAVASSKGGIGKSTAALGISRALCAAGRRVLLADLDYGNACLDLLCGVEDRVLYTSADICRGICSPADAVIKPQEDGLYLLAAPAGGRTLILPSEPAEKEDSTSAFPTGEAQEGTGTADGAGTAEGMGTAEGYAVYASGLADAVRSAAEAVGAEYVIADTGAGVSGGFLVAAMLSSQAFVVAGHSPVSLRSAENTAERLNEAGVMDVRLIINNFDADGVTRRSPFSRSGIFSMIDTARIPLCGVIPYDYALTLSHEGGGRAGEISGAAFANIAARTEGRDVPLFYGMKHFRRIRRKFYI